jgi:hypothetical protein
MLQVLFGWPAGLNFPPKVLLCHVGEEHSIDAGYLQNALGNPLLLRYPLNAGVKVVLTSVTLLKATLAQVIAAHCASEGKCSDLDAPGHPTVDAFDLFVRLMDDPKYKQLLFAGQPPWPPGVCLYLHDVVLFEWQISVP